MGDRSTNGVPSKVSPLPLAVMTPGSDVPIRDDDAVVAVNREGYSPSPGDASCRAASSQRRGQASLTLQSRLATGSLSLHGKLIHSSVRFHTYSHFTTEWLFS